MNCTDVDAFLNDGTEHSTSDVGFVVLMIMGGSASLALLFVGEHVARPFAGIIAFVATAYGIMMITQSHRSAIDISCVMRIVLSVTGGAAVSALCLCLLKGGFFVLGAGAFGSVAHFTYTSLPLSVSQEYYYIAVASAAVVGGTVSVCVKKHFMRIISALLGGTGVAAVTHFVIDRATGTHPSHVVLLLVMSMSAATGVSVQYCSAKCRIRTRTLS